MAETSFHDIVAFVCSNNSQCCFMLTPSFITRGKRQHRISGSFLLFLVLLGEGTISFSWSPSGDWGWPDPKTLVICKKGTKEHCKGSVLRCSYVPLCVTMVEKTVQVQGNSSALCHWWRVLWHFLNKIINSISEIVFCSCIVSWLYITPHNSWTYLHDKGCLLKIM